MAASERPAIEALSAADVAGALALSDAAGWNQTAEDWGLFMQHGRVFGCRAEEGGLVATAAALPYASGCGWISMVLVAASHRHRGLATRLLDACVAALREAGSSPVLDATAAGREVYRRNGFVGGFAFDRWQGDSTAPPAMQTNDAAATRDRPVGEPDIACITALDAAATGIDRAFLLRSFVARSHTQALLTPDKSGFVIARAGRQATQIGPLVAAGESDAMALLAAVIETCSGRMFIDTPVRWRALAAFLGRRGFSRQRSFVRMTVEAGSPLLAANDRVFAIAGPEFG